MHTNNIYNSLINGKILSDLSTTKLQSNRCHINEKSNDFPNSCKNNHTL